MDFLKLIRSFGDLLFEVLSWLIYYPRTLWLVLIHPLQMIDYSNHEQGDSEEEQYTDTLAPPLLLFLTILVLHFLALGLGRSEHIAAANDTVQTMVNSDQNLVLLRSFLFGLLPLFAALNYVRKRKLPLERKHLRPPFFGQCYLAAVYALMISTSMGVARAHFSGAALAGAGMFFAGTVWYWAVQATQFHRSLGISWLHALASAIWVYLEALFYLVVVAILLAGGI
ncbi:hypothetical protein GRI97_11255 [Altererythrobacter xixiisoli]|uniref:Permease n=1 Tax=Croceibacterium xixiisoli TaxID=1476466 RepID=A0A6I4TTP7_9SPHN|nr:hypothetical protein [Croceibacterium xixiisoli]MXO99565.1 hypothetical protein [Croceibacterium xixiisoli]